MVKYLRNRRFEIGQSTLNAAQDAVHEQTDGIIHMLRPDKWLSLEEIARESRIYNTINNGPYDGKFETDPLKLAENMVLLVSVGMISVSYSEEE